MVKTWWPRSIVCHLWAAQELTGLGPCGELPSWPSSATCQLPWLLNIYVPWALQPLSHLHGPWYPGTPLVLAHRLGAKGWCTGGVSVRAGGCGRGATWIFPAHCATHPCLCAPWFCRKPQAPQGKTEAPEAAAQVWSLGHIQQGGKTREPPCRFLLCPTTPVSFSIETTNSSDIFQPLWRWQYVLLRGISLWHWWGSDPDVKTPGSCPCTQHLLCFTLTFLHLCPPFTSSLASLSFQSGFSHLFSHLFTYSCSLSPFFIISFQSSVFFLLL